MNSRVKRVLMLGAHTDDEFGCSGTLVKLAGQGAEIFYAVFSACEESVPEGWPSDILRSEVMDATRVIGIAPERVSLYDFKVRHFPAFRQDILEELIRLRARIDPDLVLLPATSDIHQDHGVVCAEGIRAFKQTTMLGYEMPQNSMTFRNTGYVRLEEGHVEKKIEGLACYRSQAFRNYAKPEFIRGCARMRGTQVGAEYAEAFEVIRLVW